MYTKRTVKGSLSRGHGAFLVAMMFLLLMIGASPAQGATVPDAPTNVSVASVGDGRATIKFTPPASDGGSPIKDYTVISYPGNIRSTAVGGLITVGGLTNGSKYTFTVFARNAVGVGPESAPSASVVVQTTPGAPTSVAAAAGVGSATVKFVPPASDGGSKIVDYNVISHPDNVRSTSATSPITVGGLTKGTTYTFTVFARNAAGNGPESAPSNSIVPKAQ